MTATPAGARVRPVIRNIHITDLVRYKLPVPGMVSIMHRVSGALMFLLLPLVLWLFDLSLTSEGTYERLHRFASNWFARLVLLALGWALLHHLCAGVRHVLMDLELGVHLRAARRNAWLVFAASLPLTLLLALALFGAI
ncbi:MAG TPA: succinate dehydrogenase, cytochrome b556 subunit [Burkholderiaceae bacterium]